jgi:hypothetical protein
MRRLMGGDSSSVLRNDSPDHLLPESSFIISTALIVYLLFTVYLYYQLLLSTVQCLLLLCVWGYSISLRQGAMTDYRVAVHAFNVASYGRASPGCPILR